MSNSNKVRIAENPISNRLVAGIGIQADCFIYNELRCITEKESERCRLLFTDKYNTGIFTFNPDAYIIWQML